MKNKKGGSKMFGGLTVLVDKEGNPLIKEGY